MLKLEKIGVMKFKKRTTAQVWIETIIYTLIGLTIMGLLLAVAKPKIDSMKDNSLIEQSIESLGKINSKISEILNTPGNLRVFDLKIGKGKFVIDGVGDKIYWEMESNFQYSESDVSVQVGVVNVKTTGEDNPWIVMLEIPYNNFDIRFDNASMTKTFEENSNVYSFGIENLGTINGEYVINFKELN